MNKIRIFIADDIKEVRDQFIDKLKDYAEKNYQNPDYFSITSAESFTKAHQIISETSKSNTYFDIFFADIDFTEDRKGGRADSGYKLIETMYQVCPTTFICTHSGQFHGKDLWPKYEELKGKGLILHTMDKSHKDAGGDKWFNDNITEILRIINQNKFLWDIWKNHKNIIDKLNHKKLDDDQFENLSKIRSIISNLDSILTLLKNKDKFDEIIIIYRLIIYLYHNSLEIFCRGNLTDDEIIKHSDANKDYVENLIDKHDPIQFSNKVSSIRVIISFSKERISQFGFKLNNYRNKSIHPNDNNFKLELGNILFANLTLSTYILNKEEISYDNFNEYLHNTQNKSVNDLKMIVSYLSS